MVRFKKDNNEDEDKLSSKIKKNFKPFITGILTALLIIFFILIFILFYILGNTKHTTIICGVSSESTTSEDMSSEDNSSDDYYEQANIISHIKKLCNQYLDIYYEKDDDIEYINSLYYEDNYLNVVSSSSNYFYIISFPYIGEYTVDEVLEDISTTTELGLIKSIKKSISKIVDISKLDAFKDLYQSSKGITYKDVEPNYIYYGINKVDNDYQLINRLIYDGSSFNEVSIITIDDQESLYYELINYLYLFEETNYSSLSLDVSSEVFSSEELISSEQVSSEETSSVNEWENVDIITIKNEYNKICPYNHLTINNYYGDLNAASYIKTGDNWEIESSSIGLDETNFEEFKFVEDDLDILGSAVIERYYDGSKYRILQVEVDGVQEIILDQYLCISSQLIKNGEDIIETLLICSWSE